VNVAAGTVDDGAPIIEVDGLDAGYGSMHVLHSVTMHVSARERVGLVGLNGHGKTTLLRALIGATGWQRGAVKVGGHEVERMSPDRLARDGIVMIPQGDAVFPGLTVKDNLMSGAYPKRQWPERDTRLAFVIDTFPRLGERLGQMAGSLSGGERRMLSIGRGLMTGGRLYLVDEPSLGLSPALAEMITAKLANLDLERGAMVIAEQNQLLLKDRVDRYLRMHAGQLSDYEPAGVERHEEASP
jgi:branched-chain amino acid transport system ATP-binding protein